MRLRKNFVKISLTILGLFILQSTFGQKNYVQGYIIQLKGDTLHGLIDYQNWGINPDKISFKKTMDDNETSYSPSGIKGFGVFNDIYESANATIETSPYNENNLTYNAELQIETKPTFLQKIIQGKKSLYYYRHKDGMQNFFIKEDSSFVLLAYKRYKKDSNDGSQTILAENKKYMGQLLNYLKDCDAISSKIKDTKYNKEGLEELFNFYYSRTNSEIKFQKKTEKLKTEIGLFAGMSLTSIFVNSPYRIKGKTDQSMNFTAGLFFDIILPRNRGKWSICNELIYTSYKVKNDFTKYENENYYSNIHVQMQSTLLKLNSLLRYRYSIKKVHLFLNAGLSVNVYNKETNDVGTTTNFYGTQNYIYLKGSDHGSAKNYVLGIGSKYKRLSFEVRYESFKRTTENRYYFLVGYKF